MLSFLVCSFLQNVLREFLFVSDFLVNFVESFVNSFDIKGLPRDYFVANLCEFFKYYFVLFLIIMIQDKPILKFG